jgi:hypothetical protein
MKHKPYILLITTIFVTLVITACANTPTTGGQGVDAEILTLLEEYVKSAGGTIQWDVPAADGSAGQVLKTDGAGSLSWQNDATGDGGGSSLWTDAGGGNIQYTGGNVGIGNDLAVSGSLQIGNDTAWQDGGTNLLYTPDSLSVEGTVTITGGHVPDYDSGWFAIVNNNGYTKAHSIGAIPKQVQMLYSPNSSGTPSYIVGMMNTSYDNGYNVKMTATSFYIRTGDSNVCLYHDGTSYLSATSGYYRFMAWK